MSRKKAPAHSKGRCSGTYMQLGDKSPSLLKRREGWGDGGCEAPHTHLESRKVGMTKTPNSQLVNGGWAMETLPLTPIGLEGRGAQ